MPLGAPCATHSAAERPGELAAQRDGPGDYLRDGPRAHLRDSGPGTAPHGAPRDFLRGVPPVPVAPAVETGVAIGLATAAAWVVVTALVVACFVVLRELPRCRRLQRRERLLHAPPRSAGAPAPPEALFAAGARLFAVLGSIAAHKGTDEVGARAVSAETSPLSAHPRRYSEGTQRSIVLARGVE